MRSVALIDCEHRPRHTTNHYYSASMTEPLGLLYLEAFLANHSVPVSVFRTPLTAEDWETVRTAHIVGISGLTYSWPVMLRLAKLMKGKNPCAIVVAGREHATCVPEEVLKHPEFDLVITGEGEKGLLALAQGLPYEEVPGAVFRGDKGALHQTDRGTRLTDEDIFPLRRQLKWMVNMLPETTPLFSLQAGLIMGRGCPFKCVFCTAPKMWNGYKSQGIRKAVDEIQRTYEAYGVHYFAMHDLMLNVQKYELEAFCREIINLDLDLSFFGFLSATKLRIDMKLMRQAGFHEFGIGIEIPGPERVNLGKRFSFDTVRQFFQEASSSGVFTKGYTMIGWPWDRDEDEIVDRYVRALRTTPVNNLRVTFLTPFPGTTTFEEYRDHIAFPLNDEAYTRFTTMEPILDFGLSTHSLVRARERILRGYFSSPEYDQLLSTQSRMGIVDEMNGAMCEWMKNSGLLAA